MRTHLWFNTIWVDTLDFLAGQLIPAGMEFNLFTDRDVPPEAPVIKETETAIINWLLQSPARYLMLDSLSLSRNSVTKAAVGKPLIDDSQQKPGDIDLLICSPGRADLSVALQCKRVTVEVEEDGSDQIRKLGDIKDVVMQANKQRTRYGFHQNYLAIVIQSFVARRSEKAVVARGITAETLGRIYDFNYRDKIHEDVGIVFIEITQPTMRSVKNAAQIGVCVDRRATPLVQTPELTQRIRQFFKT